MKRIITTIICFLCIVTTVMAQKAKSPVAFDTYEWNFGAIDPADGTVCHTFNFRNNSKEAVTISKDIPSCDCIRAFYDDDAVLPGGHAEVLIAYSPKKDTGKSHRRVELLDSNGNTLASLSIEANVLEEGSVPERKYPYLDVNLSYAERFISILTTHI